MLSSSKRCHSNTEEMRALFAASIRGRKAPVGLHRLAKETYIHTAVIILNKNSESWKIEFFSKNNMFKKLVHIFKRIPKIVYLRLFES